METKMYLYAWLSGNTRIVYCPSHIEGMQAEGWILLGTQTVYFDLPPEDETLARLAETQRAGLNAQKERLQAQLDALG